MHPKLHFLWNLSPYRSPMGLKAVVQSATPQTENSATGNGAFPVHRTPMRPPLVSQTPVQSTTPPPVFPKLSSNWILGRNTCTKMGVRSQGSSNKPPFIGSANTQRAAGDIIRGHPLCPQVAPLFIRVISPTKCAVCARRMDIPIPDPLPEPSAQNT